MKDISRMFKSQKNKPDRWIWQQTREGKKVRAICDYIFSGETIKWRNFVPIDIDFDTDHRLLAAKLESNEIEKYKRYVKMRIKPQVKLFPPESKISSSSLNDQNMLFKSIMESMNKEKKSRKEKESWISEKTYKILSSKVKAL